MSQQMQTTTCLSSGDQDVDQTDLFRKAACLINPESGIANDFLNHFNEILLLIENLPILLPEMVDELLTWSPLSYTEYFERSNLPGRGVALARYQAMPEGSRAYFDSAVESLNSAAVDVVAKLSTHRAGDGSIDPESVAEYCGQASKVFGEELERLASFVNSGAVSPAGTNPLQCRAV